MTLNSYTIPANIPRTDDQVQTFITDPQRLVIFTDAQLDKFIRGLSNHNKSVLFIHGSYLLSDLGKGFQRKLLRQETTVASAIKAQLYILHLPAKHKPMDQFIQQHQILQSGSTKLAFENTSARVPPSYIKSLTNRTLVIDTAHLFCSGLARDAQTALMLIKTLNRTSNIVAIHLNDQAGRFNSGKDQHCAIGRGNLFRRDPESLELLWYIINKFIVVFEYNQQDLTPGHVDTIRAYKQNNLIADLDLLTRASVMSGQLAAASSNQFQQQVYNAYAEAFLEVSGKECKLTIAGLRNYGFTDKGEQILIYASLHPRLSNIVDSGEYGVPLARGVQLYKYIARIMEAIPERECFVAGSIRREKARVGDIDVVLLSDYASKCISNLVSAEFLPRGVVDQQDRALYRFNILTEKGGAPIQIDLHICSRAELACTMLYLTGSKYFNLRMRRIAKSLGFKLSNRDLTLLKNKRRIPVQSEREVFAKLNMDYVAPRFRVM